jgi:acetoin utilization deacetylase AcuC-like enzyme
MHHPEQPARLTAISDRLVASGLDMVLHHFDAPLAARERLLAAHDEQYVEHVFATAPASGHVWLDGDTAMNEHTLRAARRAVGAACLGVDLVMQDKARQAFCAVRPPGHHAERGRGMGFCIFNNVAIAAMHALRAHGLERVAIVDFDVHHGNGTEDIVSGDQRILFCSSFQHPFYPYTGFDTQAPNIVDTPLPAGSGGAALREAVEGKWLPRLREFEPQLLLISAGFDGHAADDMAQLNFVDSDYAWVTTALCEAVQESAQRRVVSVLEGGYDLHALARSVEAHIKAFMDF